jgi:hypothetical protein
MEVTVVSADGLDSARAVIRTKHTRKNAIAFCREYVQKVTEACIAETLAIPLNEEISGNCQTGEFVDFSGARHRFEGPAPKGNSDYMPEYRLRSLETGELADGSMASGYPVNLEIFRALCPSVGRGKFPQGSAAHAPGSSIPVASGELDRIRRHYSKNVNFPKAYAGRVLTVTGTAAATNPRSSYRVKIEMRRRGGEDVTARCLTMTGAMPVGASVTASGTLSDPVYTHDEGGEAFYLKDCTVKPAG